MVRDIKRNMVRDAKRKHARLISKLKPTKRAVTCMDDQTYYQTEFHSQMHIDEGGRDEVLRSQSPLYKQALRVSEATHETEGTRKTSV